MLLDPIVRRRVGAIFAALSRGDASVALAGLAPDVHHRFAGDTPVGGERHTSAAVEEWFGRLFRLFPSIVFTVQRIGSSGWPWDLVVTVEWTAAIAPAAGPPYANVGAHVIRIRRGKVVCLHAYEDSQAVAEACRVMAEAGITEASAPPITS